MGTTADKLTYLIGTKAAIKNSIINKGVEVSDDDTFRSYAAKIDSIETGGASTQSQNIFTGWTMPLTYQGTPDNLFTYESTTHNITISGLGDIASINGNGTKKVDVTINVTESENRQTPFVITCVNGDETLIYNGIAFHYGEILGDGKCLAVAQTISGTPRAVSYIFIESTSLPTFLYSSTSWNGVYSYQIQSFTFGKWMGNAIGNFFMYYCYSFNQPLTIPNSVTSIGIEFLYNCYSFNQPLVMSNSVTNVGGGFMSTCYSFNQSLVMSNSVTSVGGSFMHNCYSFNQPLTIPNSVTSIGTNFMNGCYSFNQPLVMSNSVTNVGNYFLYQCYSFNQPLTIPNSVTSIGSYFMNSCYSFNQSLTIPNSVTSIGNYFMNGCYSFNQPLVMSNSVTNVGNYFMYGCYSFMHLIYNASVYPTDNNSLSQSMNPKTLANGTGILITGTQAAELKAALPDRTESPYRKLVLEND